MQDNLCELKEQERIKKGWLTLEKSKFVELRENPMAPDL
jgi:hypothetical protein